MASKQKIVRYQELSEVLKPQQVAALLGISKPVLMPWLRSGKSPFGELKEGFHFFKVGDEYRIIKDRVCELFGILPKELARPKEGQACGKS